MAAQPACHAPAAVTLRVRFAGEAPRDAVLRSTIPDGLLLVDPDTGRELWSATRGSTSTQQIAGLDAAFGTSLTAIHLDEDGLHDRIYAGDRAGRLWRFDLRAGARPSAWMRAVLVAELGVPGGGRGFIAAPDVTRMETPGAPPWLNIALGTANTGAPRSDHRFYVLRDGLDGLLSAAPIHEIDLEPRSPPLGLSHPSIRGFYITLGPSQVLAPSLTLNGFIHYTAVEGGRGMLAACDIGTLPANEVPITVTVIRAEDGDVTADINGDGVVDQRDLRRSIPGALPAYTAVTLATIAVGAEASVQCRVGNEPLPGCLLDTQPRRSWWRREDSD